MTEKKNGVVASEEIEEVTPSVEVAREQEGESLPAGVSASSVEQDGWSVARALSGRKILVTGATGFLAKVLVSMILRYHADVDQIYVVIRSRRTATAQERFQQELVENGTFNPLREIYGPGLQDFIDEKVTVISGDITSRYLGMSEEDARALSSTLDVFINSAGLTNFNPNLEHALEINTLSEYNIQEFIELGDYHCALEHISTCFVAGNTREPSPEILPTPDYFPAADELGVEFDVDREIEDCQRMIAHGKELAEDQEQTSAFHRDALALLKKRNLNPEKSSYYDAAYKEVRDAWIKNHLSYRGRDRAAHWGFPNIYTYTKSMGERLLAKNKGKINFAILRPAIVESSMSYPETGWNEGVNTSAPLAYLRYKGHRYFPLGKENSLDIIPVDYVCGAMISVAAALIIGRNEHDVYQLGSSDQAPLYMDRLLELVSLSARKLRATEVNTPQWQKLVLDAMEGAVVTESTFKRRSAPGISKAVKGFRALLGNLPTKSMGGVGKMIRTVDKTASGLEKATGTMGKMFEIFMPFIMYNKYTFIARNIDAIRHQLPEHEKERYGSPMAGFDWRHYWMDVHMPGLARHVFPNLEDKLRTNNKKSYTYEDLVDLFDSSTSNFAKRIAFQHHDGQITERYTYEELGERAQRARLVLESFGVGAGSPVMLVAENRPQWGMTYFGILKARAVAVPVDPDSADLKIARLAASCKARVIVVSDKIHAERADAIDACLKEVEHHARLVKFSQLFTLALPAGEDAATVIDLGGPAQAVDAPDDLASLIYTSGTTGNPKGVMLTHRNFAHLVNSMQQIFNKVNERDGFLSVLPLHHTFEFSAGLLMPISRGSTITYMEELNGDELTRALKNTRVTALIGVPALWQLLFKRIDQRLNDAPPAIRWTIKQLLFLNRTMREKTRINIGPMLFGAIHRAFGGKIKYFISGGAALPADLLKSFYSMGFNMYEGYGLTEAAPVLTVNRPEKGLLPGSVGRALPGVEVEIRNPDDEGVGEVVARGDNVMAGYLGLDDETARALQDGWLHTGDLGKLDEKGNLTIVGRAKDVIVTHGGKNVYPDELEELYGEHRAISEISVVGLDDGRGAERVAALVRPEIDEDASDEEIADVRAQIREWFRVEGTRVAAHERIQLVRFWDDELPRTATRKIKRTAVIEILERLLGAEEKAHEEEGHDEKWLWLDRVIGNLCDYEAERIFPSSRFQDDLGFDSLMVVEMGSILEARGYHLPSERLSQLQTVAELRDALEGKDASTALTTTKSGTLERVGEYRIPPFVAKLGKDLLYNAQMRSYGDFFDVEVYGRGNIPHHNPNIIVAANHSSHLDMGLVKYALGDFGNSIRAVAAADYFYKNKMRKTYFTNFTNLLPIERSGNLETSLGHAESALRAGEMLLIFPEGTRSRDGKLQSFKKGIGYLVASQQVTVLPIFIEGTHRALPKGQSLPSVGARRLKVIIGKPLEARDLLAAANEAPNVVEGYQVISDKIREQIVALRDRKKRKKKKMGVELAPVFNSLPGKFAASKVDSRISFYFSLGDSDDEKWTVTADASTCDVTMGKPSGGKADCVVKTSPEIFRKMVEESYEPSYDEFMSGAIKTSDLTLLMRFQAVFQL